MKLETITTSTKEIFLDAGGITVTINTWGNCEGVSLMVHGKGPELPLRMAGAFRWEELDAILVALAAARAAWRGANLPATAGAGGMMSEEANPAVAGQVERRVRLHDLPPEGTALRKLGARLAELLDEDQWSDCERMLFEVADEQRGELEDKAYVASKALRRAWQLGQTYWQQADSKYPSQWKRSDATHAKFQELVDETRAAILVQPNA
jgi:hypothetical protein